MKKTEAISIIKHVTATFQFLTDKYFKSLDWTMEENGFKSIKWGEGRINLLNSMVWNVFLNTYNCISKIPN